MKETIEDELRLALVAERISHGLALDFINQMGFGGAFALYMQNPTENPQDLAAAAFLSEMGDPEEPPMVKYKL